MAFFLLARGADDDVELLTPTLLSSRQEALAELSRLTADPAFLHWDAEILVVDVDAGVPVLLMRPSAPADAPVASSEQSVFDETAESMSMPAVIFGQPLVAEQVESALVEIDSVEPDETAVALIADDVEIDFVADSFAPDSEATPTDDPATQPVEEDLVADEAPLNTFAEDSSSSEDLRGALLRTASVMEASGIVAPESIGPAEPAAEVDDDLMLDDFIAAITLDEVTEPVVDESLEEEVKSPVLVDEVMVPASEQQSVAVPESLSDDDSDSVTAAWPWDVTLPADVDEVEAVPEAAAESDFILGDLEAPGTDSSDMLRVSIDDETLAANRPVILGAYGDSDVTLEAEPAKSDVASGDSGATVAESPLDAYTCADCVYEETCPNKDQRLPRDCGSFQWK